MHSRGVLAALTALMVPGLAWAADLRPGWSPSSGVPGPRWVQGGDVRSSSCLFGCFGYRPQAAAAPSRPPEPRRAIVRREKVQHAFAQARSPKRDGRSVAIAPKVSRPAVPDQAVVWKPVYTMPLDVDAMPAGWQLRAAPPVGAPAAAPVPGGPFGGLKGL